jgi:RNA polymerase sigma factor for flagellar operon FliA
MSEQTPTLQGAAKKLVESHLHLVESIARGVASDFPKITDLSELISLGRMGLVDAATRYDPRQGASFSTFATYRIRGSILDGIRKLMPMSRSMWQKIQFRKKANEFLEDKSQEPTKTGAEEAQALEDIAADVTAIFITSFDAMLSDGKDVVQEQVSPEEKASTNELVSMLAIARKKLNPKDNEFLRLCYDEGLSITEAGKRCGFTKGWASRLHSRLIHDLACEMGAPLAEAPP